MIALHCHKQDVCNCHDESKAETGSHEIIIHRKLWRGLREHSVPARQMGKYITQLHNYKLSKMNNHEAEGFPTPDEKSQSLPPFPEMSWFSNPGLLNYRKG